MPTDVQTELLQGEDRIAIWEPAGRPVRMGTPGALRVSDVERMRRLWREGDEAGARAALEYHHAQYAGLIAIYAEWIQAWPKAIAALRGADDADRLQGACEGDAPDAPALQASLAAAKDAVTDVASLEAYMAAFRPVHDSLVRRVSRYAAAAAEMFGQETAEQAMRRSLEACSFVDAMWAPVALLRPDELAAVLADHLRAHLSGAGQEGAVAIVEDADCYRLVLDPCGSGGVLRRADPAAAGSFREASPLTWGRTDGVPPYCAHCALNEAISVARLGYAAWVTQFDPDPTRPCAWVIAKRRPDGPRERHGSPQTGS